MNLLAEVESNLLPKGVDGEGFAKKLNAWEKYDKLQLAPGQDISDYHASWDDCIQDMRDSRNRPDDETLIVWAKEKLSLE